ncbi:uncharacterized protein LOC128254054 [Drosophila gunungcola]|uniref:TIL domain-containing protein n=1 Tax=Drosophila gunungcola TaxID=103775 RepID=A0A9P9YM55_9MUSC|nr:uncharacterized protein LOC128254054 [Drosophila gunungcola]KAI8039565.1 hypothetical protein M5D96_006979 [Drosophila gunungcola]
MRFSILVAALFCQILLQAHGFDHDHAYRTCEGKVYYDCYDFCRRGCSETMGRCVHRCLNGCGCVAGSIIRNNGGCKRVIKCTSDDQDSASMENQDYSGQYVTDWWEEMQPMLETALKKAVPALLEGTSNRGRANDIPPGESIEWSRDVEPVLLPALNQHPGLEKILEKRR